MKNILSSSTPFLFIAVIVAAILMFSSTNEGDTLATDEDESLSTSDLAHTESIDKEVDHEEMRTIAKTLQNILQEEKAIESVGVDYQQLITIETTFDHSDPSVDNQLEEIKHTVEHTLASHEDLNSIPHIELYEVDVRNRRGDSDEEEIDKKEQLKMEEVSKLTLAILDGLERDDIRTARVLQKRKLITIGTSLDHSEDNIEDITEKIELEVSETIDSLNFEAIPNGNEYHIEIVDKDGNVIH
ncbi:hypothetical protein [Evansella halocellulosilytica]|uniref:hypothetical protein n=1 Tax=Evansella halocellulosilytica TaxID=2011013 RepID=UPI000BB85C67|nr:hypothetical protein [Evansella halocellulosilytica]